MKATTYVKFAVRILAVILLAMSITACGNGESDKEQGSKQVGIESTQYTLAVNGQHLYPGMLMPKNLGEPTSYFEAASCAIEGLDKNYTYHSILITTEDDGKTERITGMTILDDGVTTNAGITIGDSKDQVISAYGTPAHETGTAVSYNFGTVTLKFLLRDGVITSIIYSLAA